MATAKKSAITFTLRLGKNVVEGDASDRQTTTKLVDAIAGEAIGLADRRTQVALGRLAKELEVRIANEYIQGIRFAATNLIGLKSRGIDPIPIYLAGKLGEVHIGPRAGDIRVPSGSGGVINWQPLAKTFYDKKKPQPPSFFLRTGRLRATLLRTARTIVNKTGVARVTFHDDNPRLREGGRFTAWRNSKQIVPIGTLQVRLLPNIPMSLLPGVAAHDLGKTDPTQQFEQALHLGRATTAKLFGPLHAHKPSQRPLLQPIFTYWTLFKIPVAIADAINASIYRASTKGGVEDVDISGVHL